MLQKQFEEKHLKSEIKPSPQRENRITKRKQNKERTKTE